MHRESQPLPSAFISGPSRPVGAGSAEGGEVDMLSGTRAVLDEAVVPRDVVPVGPSPRSRRRDDDLVDRGPSSRSRRVPIASSSDRERWPKVGWCTRGLRCTLSPSRAELPRSRRRRPAGCTARTSDCGSASSGLPTSTSNAAAFLPMSVISMSIWKMGWKYRRHRTGCRGSTGFLPGAIEGAERNRPSGRRDLAAPALENSR